MSNELIVTVLCQGRRHRIRHVPNQGLELLDHPPEEMERLRNFQELGGHVRCLEVLEAFQSTRCLKVPPKLRPWMKPRQAVYSMDGEFISASPESALRRGICREAAEAIEDCDYKRARSRYTLGGDHEVKISISDRVNCRLHYDYICGYTGKGGYNTTFEVRLRRDWLAKVHANGLDVAHDKDGKKYFVMDMTKKVVRPDGSVTWGAVIMYQHSYELYPASVALRRKDDKLRIYWSHTQAFLESQQ